MQHSLDMAKTGQIKGITFLSSCNGGHKDVTKRQDNSKNLSRHTCSYTKTEQGNSNFISRAHQQPKPLPLPGNDKTSKIYYYFIFSLKVNRLQQLTKQLTLFLTVLKYLKHSLKFTSLINKKPTMMVVLEFIPFMIMVFLIK